MKLKQILHKRNIIQQHEEWYVLDDDFSYSVKELHDTVFNYIDSLDIPIIFCSRLEASRIVTELGDEEDYLGFRFASAVYWKESNVIFIFDYNEHLPLIETLFHELRHVMQDLDNNFRHHFESDKKLPYKERITEIDAFKFAKDKLNEFLGSN